MRNTTFSAAVVILAALAPTASAADYVFGSFEASALGNGWKNWSDSYGVNEYESSTIGATNGSMSIRVSPGAAGFNQNLAVNLQQLPDNAAAFQGFLTNTHIAFDVTWAPSATEWVLQPSPAWNGARVMLVYNEQGSGWNTPMLGQDVGSDYGFRAPDIDTGNPNNPGLWDIGNYPTLHTRTLMWDYSAALPLLTSTATSGYTEFIMQTNFGSFDFPYPLYIDNVRFTTPAAGVPGDYNGDDVVNAADYTVWRDHLGENYTLPNEVENTTTGMVTIDDYNAWKTRFGNTPSGSGSLGLDAGGVPEPAAWLLAVLAAVSTCCPKRRRC